MLESIPITSMTYAIHVPKLVRGSTATNIGHLQAERRTGSRRASTSNVNRLKWCFREGTFDRRSGNNVSDHGCGFLYPVRGTKYEYPLPVSPLCVNFATSVLTV